MRLVVARVGVLGDVHGNLIALEAGQAYLRGIGVDRIVCAGDPGMPARLRQIQAIEAWSQRRLSPAALAWLAALPGRLELGVGLLVVTAQAGLRRDRVHGSLPATPRPAEGRAAPIQSGRGTWPHDPAAPRDHLRGCSIQPGAAATIQPPPGKIGANASSSVPRPPQAAREEATMTRDTHPTSSQRPPSRARPAHDPHRRRMPRAAALAR